jgi:hypothetical protein
MDHSSHDHHHMDHSAHGGHGDMGGDGGHKCNMNVSIYFITFPFIDPHPLNYLGTDRPQMLFTWDTTDLCVVFRQWHITSTMSLVVSLAAIVAICAGYEALREGIRQYEAALAKRVDTAPRKSTLPSTHTSPILCPPSPPPPPPTHHFQCIHTTANETPSLRTATSRPALEFPDPRRRRRHHGGILKRLREKKKKNQLLRQPPFSRRSAQARTGSRSRARRTSPRRCCTACRTFTPL